MRPWVGEGEDQPIDAASLTAICQHVPCAAFEPEDI